MLARDNYPDDSGIVPRPSVHKRRFFLAKGTDSVKALEYFVAHYAPRHEVRPVLLVVLPDVILISVRDPLGRRPQYLRDVNSAFVRYLNRCLDTSGGMIRPGDPKPIIAVDADSEFAALLEAALAPTQEITPFSRTWCGTIFTPEDAGEWRTAERPEKVNPKTYPAEAIDYQIAKPEFQDGDSFHQIKTRFRTHRRAAEARLQAQAQKTGKRFIGANAPELFDPNFLPKEPLFEPSEDRLRGAPELVAVARVRSKNYHVRYRECVRDLRAGRIGILWPAGTNFHHVINGFPRDPAGRLTPLME